MLRKLIVVLVILGFCGVLTAGERPTMPPGMKGFAGMLECTLIEKTDRGLVAKITAIKEVWKHSKAENPRAAIGSVILIIPRQTKARDGKFYPDENVVKFMRLLKKGDSFIADVKQDGEVFVFLELTKEQRERLAGIAGDKEREAKKEEPREGDKEARKREENREREEAKKREENREREEKEAREREGRKDEPRDNEKNKEEAAKPRENNLPEGAKGFSGKLEGVVVGKVENGFILKVTKVLNVWEKNRAENPESLIGLEVVINVQWVKGADGNWQPNERHIRFVRMLEKGQTIQIEVINDEGNRLHILELSAEQREKSEPKKEERKKDKDDENI